MVLSLNQSTLNKFRLVQLPNTNYRNHHFTYHFKSTLYSLDENMTLYFCLFFASNKEYIIFSHCFCSLPSQRENICHWRFLNNIEKRKKSNNNRIRSKNNFFEFSFKKIQIINAVTNMSNLNLYCNTRLLTGSRIIESATYCDGHVIF